jgi:hypothetical protein
MTTLELSKTARGFGLGEFKDAEGVDCSIQDSSLATQAAIWFGVVKANPQKMEDGKLVPVEPPVKPIPIHGWPGLTHDILYNTRMHLTIRHVKTLIRNFEKFLETKQVRKRTFNDRYGSVCSIRLTNGLIELGCDDAHPQICDRGWRPVVFPEGTIFTTHMFLGVDEITELLPIMKRFANGGFVTEPKKE